MDNEPFDKEVQTVTQHRYMPATDPFTEKHLASKDSPPRDPRMYHTTATTHDYAQEFEKKRKTLRKSREALHLAQALEYSKNSRSSRNTRKSHTISPARASWAKEKKTRERKIAALHAAQGDIIAHAKRQSDSKEHVTNRLRVEKWRQENVKEQLRKEKEEDRRKGEVEEEVKNGSEKDAEKLAREKVRERIKKERDLAMVRFEDIQKKQVEARHYSEKEFSNNLKLDSHLAKKRHKAHEVSFFSLFFLSSY